MRSLLIAGALAVGLSFSAASQAEVNAFGVQIPVQQSEVSDRYSRWLCSSKSRRYISGTEASRLK